MSNNIKAILIVILILAILIGGYFGITQVKKLIKENNKIEINKSVIIDDVKFTIEAVTNTKKLNSGKITTTANFLIVHLNILNNKKSTTKIYESYFTLYKDKSIYKTQFSISIKEALFFSIDIEAELSKNTIIIFETPDKSIESNYTLEIYTGYYNQKQMIDLYKV